MLFNVEANYDELHIRDDLTGELLYIGTGPASGGSYQVAEVDVPSNAFSIGVVSDASVNRPQSWRLIEVEIDP